MGAFLYFKTKFFEKKEQKKVRELFYPNAAFKQADRALLKAYKRKNPYTMSKEYLLEQKAVDLYTYGETPLTTIDWIAREFGIRDGDRLIEMGAGRGRAALFLAEYVGCEVRAYERIPQFVEIMKSIDAPRLTVLKKDMKTADFSWANFIYLYGTMLIDPEIHALIARFPKEAKIITVSYPLEAYSENYHACKTLKGRFPWGETEVYLNERIQ